MPRPKAPFRVHTIDDDAWRGPLTVAAIRYDGDPDVFVALAWAHLAREGQAYPIQPPVYTRFRFQPDPSRYYDTVIADCPDGGRGTWAGARVVIDLGR